MLPTKFGVNWLLGLGDEAKIDFQNGHHSDHLGFPIGTILATFDLQVSPMLPTYIKVNKPFGSEEEEKNRFLRFRPSWNSDRNDLRFFLSISHPSASYQVWSQLAFGFRRRSEKSIFKMAAMAAVLDFRSARF